MSSMGVAVVLGAEHPASGPARTAVSTSSERAESAQSRCRIMRGLYHERGANPARDRKPPYDHAVTGSETTDSVFLRVGAVLQQIRPAVQADGGDVELVEVTDEGLVRVRFHGACVGCACSGAHVADRRSLEAES